MNRGTRDPQSRFWGHVYKTDGCWEWTGAIDKETGYGKFGVDGRVVGAHRIAWEYQHGPIPDGLFVLHHCDSRPCVRGDHLFLGTQADNMRDMVEKGRSSRGQHLKLDEHQVREIRYLYPARSQRSLAKEYGVAQATIGRVLRQVAA